MLKNFLFLFVLLLTDTVLSQPVNYPYLVNSQSLLGYTGNIMTPSPYILPHKKFSFGLHRFNVGVLYGINSWWETGINFDLKQFTPVSSERFNEKLLETAVHTKYHLIRQYPDDQPLDFSVGLRKETFYIVTGRQFSELFDCFFESGLDYEYLQFNYFVSINKPFKYSCFIFDYRSRTSETNIGWRVLLGSPKVKLDLFLIDVNHMKDFFDNFIFGLTLVS